MTHPTRRNTRLARIAPLAFYVTIVLGWMADAVRFGAAELLWLAVWTVPAAAAYFWRMRP